MDNTLIKYDALSVEAMDKLHICLDLICEHGYAERKQTLRDTYENIIGIYKLERDDPKMWNMIWNHDILSLFQMEKQSGVQGIALSHPRSVNDLCVLNSVIRLMAPDKDSDTPLVTWSKYRENIQLWINEMYMYGLNEDEINWLASHSAITDGICESQEGLMSLVQEDRLGGNSLSFADQCRKGIAKKQGKLFQTCEDTFYENIKKNKCSEKLAHYVWDVLLKVQRGYSFNRSHCLAYSLVALQEMNLAYKYPIIFWDCACLISDSGVSEEDGMTDYTKIAQALGIIQTANISISPVNINRSEYIFKPDVKNNTIMFGLGALSGLNQETIQTIETGRPYNSIADFMNRCPLNKTAMFSLIRAGAFDETDAEWSQRISPVEPRKAIMAYYISQVSEPKKKLNLQNFSTLLQRGLVPEALDFQKRVFAFNKYLKERKYETYYIFDAPCERFYNSYFDTELLEVVRGAVAIPQKKWDKIYSVQMDAAREWLKDNQSLVLKELNTQLFKECWDKYADGTVSAWEMKAMCYYYHPHELIDIDTLKYGLVDFNSLSADPDVDYYFKRNGKEIPIFKTYKIVGTVIGKNDNKSSISLLTTTGVVNVKFTKEYYAMYNRQISEVQDDGSKKVAEKGWFSRGVMLLITGFRREDTFVAKSYKHTTTHQIYRITEINGKDIVLEHERATEKI